MAKQTNGLTRLQVGRCWRQAAQGRTAVTHGHVTSSKRREIETEIATGDFTVPQYGLDAVAGADLQNGGAAGHAQACATAARVVPRHPAPGRRAAQDLTMQCFATTAASRSWSSQASSTSTSAPLSPT